MTEPIHGDARVTGCNNGHVHIVLPADGSVTVSETEIAFVLVPEAAILWANALYKVVRYIDKKGN